MTALDKAREVRDRIANEVKQEKQGEAVDTSETAMKGALQVIGDNAELMRMYQDNASLGAENLGGSSPLLKVHATGKSSGNVLANGKQPNDGWFFYKPTGEQFEEVECHILTISAGFRSPGIDETKEAKFNQIMAGILITGGKYQPFVMYVSGARLNNMWEFGKEAGAYTHAKPFGIPMFALRVKLTSEQKYNDKKMPYWDIEYEIVKDEKGQPVLVTDPGKFQFLKDSVDSAKETINNIIGAKKGAQEELMDMPDVTMEDEGDISQLPETIFS